MARLGVTLPLLNNTIRKISELAVGAEDAGFDTAFDFQYCRNVFMGLSQAALETSRIQLGTGLAPIIPRTPFETANLIADVDEMSDGRAILGIGLGTPQFMSAFHGTPPTKPVTRVREYVEMVRASWDFMTTGEPVDIRGEFHSIIIPPDAPWGGRPLVRPRIPIYLAAYGPKMIQLCGEVADGLLGAVWPVDFMAHHVLPNLKIGADRAGREVSDIDVCVETVCAVHPDRKEAVRRARIQCGMYAALPELGPLLEGYGLGAARQEVLDALAAKGPMALQDVTDDRLVELLSICGTPDEARKQFARYAEQIPHMLLHTPYAPPLLGEESEDGLRHTLEAFAR
jgi:alkanesulfonate monooxygenase SsuD/methylene tetrahydromethanopterin reductase-like flavin-dependent oxidoreductase (luciferase family)